MQKLIDERLNSTEIEIVAKNLNDKERKKFLNETNKTFSVSYHFSDEQPIANNPQGEDKKLMNSLRLSNKKPTEVMFAKFLRFFC